MKIKLVDYASYIAHEKGCRELAHSACFKLPEGTSLWIPYGNLVVPIWIGGEDKKKEHVGSCIMLPVFSKTLNKQVPSSERERFEEMVQAELHKVQSPCAPVYEDLMAKSKI